LFSRTLFIFFHLGCSAIPNVQVEIVDSELPLLLLLSFAFFFLVLRGGLSFGQLGGLFLGLGHFHDSSLQQRFGQLVAPTSQNVGGVEGEPLHCVVVRLVPGKLHGVTKQLLDSLAFAHVRQQLFVLLLALVQRLFLHQQISQSKAFFSLHYVFYLLQAWAPSEEVSGKEEI